MCNSNDDAEVRRIKKAIKALAICYRRSPSRKKVTSAVILEKCSWNNVNRSYCCYCFYYCYWFRYCSGGGGGGSDNEERTRSKRKNTTTTTTTQTLTIFHSITSSQWADHQIKPEKSYESSGTLLTGQGAMAFTHYFLTIRFTNYWINQTEKMREKEK